MERVLTNIIKSLMYSVAMALVGAIVAFILKWPILKGVYVMIIGMGVFALGAAVLFFIGTPKNRYEYFTGMRYRAQHIEHIPKNQRQSIENQAGDPAIIGIVMILIGFFIEALMH
ncbi:MAG: hypothetical protein JXO44_09095 [Clostridia bacterium]|nr:hypothetical protein [Clostridia bacterium]